MRLRSSAIPLAALAAWSAFFAWLLLSGDQVRYIGPRTAWIVPFGIAALVTLFVLSLLASVRGFSRPPASGPATLAVLLLPLVAAFAIPDARLGAHAVSRKAAAGASLVAPVPSQTDEAPLPPPARLDLPEIAQASTSSEYRAWVKPVGKRVSLVGFVSQSYRPEGTFELSRFTINCCVADASASTVSVLAPRAGQRYDEDTWLEVAGHLVARDGKIVVAAERVAPVNPPRNPYLDRR